MTSGSVSCKTILNKVSIIKYRYPDSNLADSEPSSLRIYCYQYALNSNLTNTSMRYTRHSQLTVHKNGYLLFRFFILFEMHSIIRTKKFTNYFYSLFYWGNLLNVVPILSCRMRVPNCVFLNITIILVSECSHRRDRKVFIYFLLL